MVPITNAWTQFMLVLAMGIACAAMAAWFGAQRVRPHKPAPLMGTRSITSYVPQPTLVPRTPSLEITSVVQHGHIVEIRGRTEPGTVVMINGQPAVTIFNENEFRHFLGPMPAGTTIVSVTCQNEEGGVQTQQLAINVE
jgi:hypothetical protein